MLKETLYTSTVVGEKLEEQRGKVSTKEKEVVSRNKQGASDLLKKLKRIMWDHVGVVRTPVGLTHALSEIALIKEEACDLYEKSVCTETVGIRDAAFAGEAVANSALANRVSAGAHCIALESPEAKNLDITSDYPAEDRVDEIGGFLRLR